MPKGYGPGANLTANNRFARMLMDQERNAAPITTHTQGLASLLRSGMAGYLQGQDANDQQAAMEALTKGAGAKPWVNPDTGQAQGTAGGLEGMISAQQGLEGNPYAQRNLQQLLMQREGREYEAGQAEKTRQAGREDFLFQESNKYRKPSIPKTVKTGEGMFILKPDGTLGNRLGSAKAETEINFGGQLSKDFRPVFGPEGQQIGAEPVPGGKEDPVTIQTKKEAERKAALNIENQKKLPARRSQIFAASQNAPAFQDAINAAKQLAVSGTTSGIAQQLFGGVAGTDAFSLERQLDTIKSNIGFGELLRIKEAGGTLGALSEMENRLLQAMQGALDPRIKGEQLVKALERVDDIQKQNLAQKKREFIDMYPDSDRPWEELNAEEDGWGIVR